MPELDFERLRPQLDNFLKDLLRTARFRLSYRIEPGGGEGPEMVVQFSGEDTDLLLARGGELLTALEHLGAKVLRLSQEQQHLLSFDCNDYQSLHVEELRLMAQTAAERVVRSQMPFAFSPMNSRDRRIIHLALKDHAAVRTESEGTGPARHIVIHPQPQK